MQVMWRWCGSLRLSTVRIATGPGPARLSTLDAHEARPDDQFFMCQHNPPESLSTVVPFVRIDPIPVGMYYRIRVGLNSEPF